MHNLLTKRPVTVDKIERRYMFLRTALSVLLAMIVAFLLIASVSETPWEDLMTFLIGPLQSVNRLSTIVEKMIPLLFTGTAVCLMYSCGQINLSAEGAFFAGAYTSTAVALIQGIPVGIHFLLCILAGGLAGAIICGIPAILHVKFNVMVVVSSLMINYVSLYLGLYLILTVLRDPQSGFEASYKFADSARLPYLIPETRIHVGLIIGIIVVVFGFVLLYKTKFGYEVRTIGNNRAFAKYSGVSVGTGIIGIQLIAGAIAGIGGTTEVLGLYSRFSYSGFTNHGWDGVMLAVLARNNPKMVPLAALFLAYIRTGADVLNRMSNIPTEVVKIVQAVVIVLVCAEGMLKKSEHKSIVRLSQSANLAQKEA